MSSSPGLYDLVVDADWESASSHCKRCPFEARTWVEKKDKDGHVIWHRLPLHEACIRDPTEAVVDALLEANPSAVEETDHTGRLPLHHACAHGASKEVVHKLVMINPDSLDAKDIWQKKPVHVAKGSTSKNRDGVLNLVDRKPMFWHVKKKEQQWVTEREDIVASLEKGFEAEREMYKDSIRKLEDAAKKLALTYEERIEKLQANAAAEKRALETTMASKQRESDGIIDSLKSEAEVERRSHKETKEALQETVSSLGSQVSGMAKDVEKLEDLKSRDKEMSKKLLDTEAAKIGLEDQLAEVKSDLESKLARVTAELDRKAHSERSIEAMVEMATSKLDGGSEPLGDEDRSRQPVEGKVADLIEKLDDVLSAVGVQREKIEIAKDEAESSKEKLETVEKSAMTATNSIKRRLHAVVESERSLAVRVDLLTAELTGVRNASDAASRSYKEGKQMLEEEVENLRGELFKLKRRKTLLEKRVQDDAATIASVNKTSADLFVQSSARIEDLDRKLDEKLEECAVHSEVYTREKKKLESKISSLENTILTLLNKRSEEQGEIKKVFDVVERALKADSEQHDRMLGTVTRQKKLLAGTTLNATCIY